MTKLGKYEILEEIGRGGFATVYKARDPDLDQVVAVKVLRGDYADRPDMVQRFLNEARKAVKLKQRGIVRIYTVGEDDGVPYIAMEYLPGGTLAGRLHGEPLPLDAAIAVVEQVAAALDHAHKRGLVHRDVKPANVLFDDEGHAVLVDFGLVKSLAESGMTVEGTSLGTPTYMAPEQAGPNAEVDGRADVYALGVVAYEMLAGRVPFEAETPLSVLHAHVHDAPPDPCALNQALDKDVAAAVLKALEKAPADRYQTAGAFARELRRAWEAAQEAAQVKATLAGLYAQAQEVMKAERWGVVVNLCVEMRDLDPDYRDVGTLLALAASRLAEEEQKRQQERELGEQYAAALALLEKEAYTEAVEALEKIEAQAPDFRDVGKELERARAGLEKARLYQAALAKLADGRHDEACDGLLALLKRDPNHAKALARLLEATEGVLAQLRDARTELEKVGSENEVLRARVTELEAKLKKAQTALKKLEPEARRLRSALKTARSHVDTYDSLLLAMEDHDQDQVLALAEKLAQAKRPGASRLLARLQAGTKEPELAEPLVGPQGDLWISPKDGKEMVRVPAGAFLYGDEKKEIELPEFWIDKTPVTNAEYARFVAATGHKPPQHWKGKTPPKEIADHPVTYVSWHDAVAYAGWAGKRLPTEEEWEKAARGTDGREYPWGDQAPAPELCSFGGNEGGTTPVGKYSPQGNSPYGCVDMAGNVWEWTASDYSRDAKVLRGGAWADNWSHVRAADRSHYTPVPRNTGVGFRCVGLPGE
jgi:formylglycine-generating enzyme required for sulfatase activity/tRNA A-37 threonylcarbamoyl transferase component Bud32